MKSFVIIVIPALVESQIVIPSDNSANGFVGRRDKIRIEMPAYILVG